MKGFLISQIERERDFDEIGMGIYFSQMED